MEREEDVESLVKEFYRALKLSERKIRGVTDEAVIRQVLSGYIITRRNHTFGDSKVKPLGERKVREQVELRSKDLVKELQQKQSCTSELDGTPSLRPAQIHSPPLIPTLSGGHNKCKCCLDVLSDMLNESKGKILDKIDLLHLKKSEHSELLSKMAVLEGEMKKLQSLKYDVSYCKLERIRELEQKIEASKVPLKKLEEERVMLEDECTCIETVMSRLLEPDDNILNILTAMPLRGRERVLEQLKLENQKWFWPCLQKKDGILLMESPEVKESSFLIRKSESNPGKYILHLKLNGKNRMFVINKYDDGRYGFSEDGNRFPSITKLVWHYQEHSLSKLFLKTDVTLQLAVPKPKFVLPVVALREKIKDLENQVAVSELVNEMKHGNLSMAKEYINLDKPFTEAISLPSTLPAIRLDIISDFVPKMSHKWDLIGCSLNMQDEVSKLRYTEKHQDSKCLQVLQTWTEHDDASWELLLKTVYTLGLQVLACQMARKLKEVSTLFSGVL